jgi:hypothetical protein
LQRVDENWLLKRGCLHDARVVAACLDAGSLGLQFHDEWTNERGLNKPENEEVPLILSFASANVLVQPLSKIVGGKASELLIAAERKFSLIFQDRDALLIRAATVGAAGLEVES